MASDSSAAWPLDPFFLVVASVFSCRSELRISIFLIMNRQYLSGKDQIHTAYRAYELCILLTNSKLLIASPRRAGVKGIVNSLKDRRFSPRSISGMLLTIFSSATLAQALLAVYTCIISKEHIQQNNRGLTWFANHNPSGQVASCFPSLSSRQRKRKIKP